MTNCYYEKTGVGSHILVDDDLDDLAEEIINEIYEDGPTEYVMIFDSDDLEFRYKLNPDKIQQLLLYMKGFCCDNQQFTFYFTIDAIVVVNKERLQRNRLR